MPKEKKVVEEVDAVVRHETRKVNEFLAEESASTEDVDAVDELVDGMSSVTKILSALAEVLVVELDDEIGATLVREFRIKFAAHEMETQ